MNLGGGTNLWVSTKEDDDGDGDEKTEEMCCSAWSVSIVNYYESNIGQFFNVFYFCLDG
jgi:hypothetical protein